MQGFARLSAVYGGTFMLDTPFKGAVTDADGEICGINSVVNGKECVLKTKAIFASPDYFPDKVCHKCVTAPAHGFPQLGSSQKFCSELSICCSRCACYSLAQVQKVGDVARMYCLLNTPIKPDGKNPLENGQIIIPGAEAGKKNDIYVMWMGKSLQVAPEGWYICLLSTQLEGAPPETELAAGLKLLPARGIAKQFMTVPALEPLQPPRPPVV